MAHKTEHIKPTPEDNPITAEDIKRGMMLGWVWLDDDGSGTTVCRIQQNWFYFGGDDADRENPFEYATNHDFDEIVADIVSAIDDFAVDDPDGEWLYYRYVLNND